jgi:Tfp pilus assembly protein PilF
LTGFVLFTAPVALFSGKTTGRYSFLPASGGINLHIGNNPDRQATEAIRPGWAWSELTRSPAKYGVERKADTSRYFRDRFLQYVRDEPVSYVAGLAAKTTQLISARELPRNVDVYTQREWSPFLSALVWKIGRFGFPFGLLLPFAVVGLVHLGRRIPLLIVLFLACYGAAVILVFVAARYRAPLVPALSIPAAAGALALVDLVRRGQRKRAGVYAALVIAVAALSSLPGPFLREQIDYHGEMLYMVGTRMIEDDEDALALELLQAALERRPDHAETHNALGNLRFKHGDHAAAATHYRRAVAIDAGFRVARDNLGRALLARGRFDEAVRQLRIVLADDPDHGAARYYCGLALARLGRLDEAASDLARAARLRPEDPRVLAGLGTVRLRQTRFDEAIAAFRSALALAPLHEPALDGLVRSLDAAGRAGEATAVLSAALERARISGPPTLAERLARKIERRRPPGR